MIIPSLLTTNERIAKERIALAEQMSGWLHLDWLDNSLYPFSSLSLDELSATDFGALALEVHAMSDNPLALLEVDLPLERLIFHVELPQWRTVYDQVTLQGLEAWLAIAPDTDIETLELPSDISGVMLMGVVPGRGGQALLSDTYDRLNILKEYYPDIPVTVDGGVSSETIRQLLACGADNFVVGQALFGQSDPLAAYQSLVRLSDPLGGMYDRETTRASGN